MSTSRDFNYLSVDTIIAINKATVEAHGGIFHILDKGLLESAVAQPMQNVFGHELNPTIQDKTAAYLFHLSQNHTFQDGNKRTGLIAASRFLAINGHEIGFSIEEAERVTLEVAAGQLTKEQLSQILEKNIRQVNPIQQQVEAHVEQVRNQALDPAQIVAATDMPQPELPTYKRLPGQSAEDHAREMQQLQQARMQQPEPVIPPPVPTITR